MIYYLLKNKETGKITSARKNKEIKRFEFRDKTVRTYHQTYKMYEIKGTIEDGVSTEAFYKRENQRVRAATLQLSGRDRPFAKAIQKTW